LITTKNIEIRNINIIDKSEEYIICKEGYLTLKILKTINLEEISSLDLDEFIMDIK
jgi:hypothetical protein